MYHLPDSRGNLTLATWGAVLELYTNSLRSSIFRGG